VTYILAGCDRASLVKTTSGLTPKAPTYTVDLEVVDSVSIEFQQARFKIGGKLEGGVA